MNILLDTNAVSNLINFKSRAMAERLAAELKSGKMVGLPALVMHELMFGALRSANPDWRLKQLRHFMSQLHGVVPFDAPDADISAELRHHLSAKGEMIGPYDALIAAQAVRLGAVLVTANVREFARVPGLQWEDWSSETVVRGEPER